MFKIGWRQESIGIRDQLLLAITVNGYCDKIQNSRAEHKQHLDFTEADTIFLIFTWKLRSKCKFKTAYISMSNFDKWFSD